MNEEIQPTTPQSFLSDDNIDGTINVIAGCLTPNNSNVNIPMILGTTFTVTLDYFGTSGTEL